MSPDDSSLPALNQAELVRYSRHLLLPGVGLDGQRRLKAAKVLVVGAGGLGSPSTMYLAAAGVGTRATNESNAIEIAIQCRVIVLLLTDDEALRPQDPNPLGPE